MPTYEYKCEECDHQFEVFARMSDPDPTQCPSCKAVALVKVLFPVAVHYKGSGFYSTDYSGAGKAPTPDGGSSGSTSDTASSATTSDSSPASSDSSTTSAPKAD